MSRELIDLLKDRLKIPAEKKGEDSKFTYTDFKPLNSSLAHLPPIEEDLDQESWETVAGSHKKTHSWDALNSNYFIRKSKSQSFIEAVKRVQGKNFANNFQLTELGAVSNEINYIFDETEEVKSAAMIFFKGLFKNEEAKKIIEETLEDVEKNPKCLLFALAKNTESRFRCYVTLSGHFPSPAKIEKLNHIFLEICIALNFKPENNILFQFRNNKSIIQVNNMLYELKSTADLLVMPCSEKTMTSLLAKKFFKYGNAMKVTGMVAVHLKFYPSTIPSAPFTIKSIPACYHCQSLKINMIKIWLIAQRSGQMIIEYMRNHGVLDKEIRQFNERFAEKNQTFFELINTKLLKTNPQEKITSTHLFDSPDINSEESPDMVAVMKTK
jgi:hypothetical protein